MTDIFKSENEQEQFLSSFVCKRDKRIQQFLQERALEFEMLSKSRTYLVLNQEQLLSNNTEPIVIYGYISLSIKILTVPDDSSNRIRKELDGFNAKICGEKINRFPCYLIGQLSRNSNIPKSVLNGRQLINMACDIIGEAVEAVGGRYIMIECQDNEKLIQFYQENKFVEISRIHNQNSKMVQMIRKI